MSGKAAFDKKLEEIAALRSEPKSAAVIDKLRCALRDRNNYIVAKAANVAGELRYTELIPGLEAAFEHFLRDAVKTDPKCWAKNAIVKALTAMEHGSINVFRSGVRHFQPEPVWGGSQDSATELRGLCAFALMEHTQLPDLEILRILTDLLCDPEPGARAAGARGIGLVGKPEGALLLRLKIHDGDRDPGVIGECFSGLLKLEPQEAVPIIGRYLDHDELAFEAVAALGESHQPEAFERLKSACEKARDTRLRNAALLAMGASRQPAAADFLIDLIGKQSADVAIEALAPFRSQEETRRRVKTAVDASGSEAARASFIRHFGTEL